MIFGVLFVAVKVWSNTSYGGSVFNGLRSGIVGLVVYSAALGVINMLSERSRLEMFGASRLGEREARLGLWITLVIYIVIVGMIIDRLQRLGHMPGSPILRFIPGWGVWFRFWEDFAWGYNWGNVLRSLPFQVVIPALMLWRLGFKWEDFALTGGDLKPALPFLFIYAGAFVTGGISLERLGFLLYALLYAGLQEEFFYRGVMQPLFTKVLRNHIWGIASTTLLFALIHIPDFVFRVYPTIPFALSSVASVGMFGALMAYGVYRTGMLWPWIVIHAISNVVGF